MTAEQRIQRLEAMVRQLQGAVADLKGGQAYGTLVYVTSRDVDAGLITLPQLANVVATMIDDLNLAGGIFGPHT